MARRFPLAILALALLGVIAYAVSATSATIAAPKLTGTSPRSPANQNLPKVRGTAPSGTNVRIYTTADCSGTVMAKGTAAALASPGIPVSVPGDATTMLSARAADGADNVSACSNALTYVEDSTPPETTITSGPSSSTTDPTPTFEFTSSEPSSTFRCRFDGQSYAPCSGPGQSHTATTALSEGSHTFAVRATDAAKNADPTPATRAFKVIKETPPDGRPNILVIVSDDQAPPELSMSVMPRTLAAFRDRGTEYTNAYVTTPLCCPSRASIFSGKYTHNHGIDSNDATAFNPDQTWQRELRAAGYYTGLLGKYLTPIPPGTAPHFDFRRSWPSDDPDDPRKGTTGARDFLALSEANDNKPWALFYAPYSPHEPLTVTPAQPSPIPAYDRPPSFGEADLSDKHPDVRTRGSVFSETGMETVRAGQLTELQALDESVGAIFDELTRLNERDNTLAFYISDNGFLWGQHGLRAKQWPYLEAVHVPFYVTWPGHVAQGAASDDLVANIDIAPTIYEATGVGPTYTVDGQSLLSGTPRSWLLLESSASAEGHQVPWTAALTDTRHYVQWADGFVEDYDLLADPWEMAASNLPQPAITTMLDSARTCAGAPCP